MSLQRVQFDRETQQAYKSQAYVKFGETICMDRFLDSADPEKRTRSKDIQMRLNASRDRIQRLTQGKVCFSGFVCFRSLSNAAAACSVCSSSRC
jgi:ubiquitin carboxyl-terminal hydrolase 25